VACGQLYHKSVNRSHKGSSGDAVIVQRDLGFKRSERTG
jgi:hypothetical protein